MKTITFECSLMIRYRDGDKIEAVIQYVQALQHNNHNSPINQELYPTQRKNNALRRI